MQKTMGKPWEKRKISGLLTMAAFDWARVSLGSAPAVAPRVSARVLPLGILK